MLFKMKNVYIEAADELEAYAKYVNYTLDEADKSGADEIPLFDVSERPQELSKKTAEEYFMPVFEKVCKMYPGAYFDFIASEYLISVILKEDEEYGDAVLFVLYVTDTEGVFEVNIGIEGDTVDTVFTILEENPYSGKFLTEVSEEAKEYLSKI